MTRPHAITILLIENNSNDAQIIERMLSETQTVSLSPAVFQLLWADKLAVGLTYLAQKPVDLVLLNLWLPDSQGLETLAQIRDQATGLPILVLTTREDQNLAIKVLQLGAQDYLIKRSLNSTMLTRVISYTIERHRLTAQLERNAQKLQASEARLRTIIEKNVDGIIIVDKKNIVRFVNPAARQLYRQQGNSLLDKVCNFPLKPGETVEHEIVDWYDHGPSIIVEIRVVETEWQGKSAFLAALRDITERKRIEAAEKELNQMKDDFIASISHQLRTPLYSVKGFIELLLKGKVDDPAIQQEFLTRAGQDADRLLDLADDLLNVIRLDSGHFNLTLEEISLDELLNEALNAVQGLAEEKQILLHHQPFSPSPQISVDRHWMQQVVINLVGNAIKFSNEASTVDIVSQATPDQITVKVIDQGTGIPDEALPHLFNKFYQADSALKRAGQGSGLGLYISKQLVEAHGGQIGVTSQVGQGSIFFFHLPRTVTEPSKSPLA